MRIKEITHSHILFDNGSKITYYHERDCCECNYADFEQLQDTGIEYEDFSEPLRFEEVKHGFRFGNPGQMYFVPCYSMQNGYYSTDVGIYYNDNQVLGVFCKLLEDY